MDWEEFICINWALLIDWLTNNVDNSSESFWSYWDDNWAAGVLDTLSSNETLGGIQGNGSHIVTTQMLGDLQYESVIGSLHLKGIKNWRKISLELHIDDGTNDL